MKHVLVFISIIIFLAACQRKQTDKQEDVYYTCSMHPQVVQDKPGKCPICHMSLIAVSRIKEAKKDEIMLSDEQIQLANIKVDTVRNRSIGKNTVFTATLNTDQQKITSLSARVMGRIDRLYFRNVGDFVRKGDKLYDLYSEELNNTKQEYLLAIEKRKELGNSIIDFNDLIQSAKNKLLLWGLSEKQMKELALNGNSSTHTSFYSPFSGYITTLDVTEGQYVMEGGTIMRLADLSTLWAEAQIYASQLSQANLNDFAEVQIPGMPEYKTMGRIEFVNPEINPSTRIILLRVIIPNTNNLLRPGMPAYVIIKGKQNNALTLPVNAVILDSKGATVWVMTAENTFKSKMVTLGVQSKGQVEITSGLNAEDIAVISGAYLLNSEYIFKKGTNPMEGHRH